MKILVTGGAGFIGSHLVERLISEGHDVVVFDNLSAGKKENINKKAGFIQGDITEYNEIYKALSGCGVVFHLAAIASVVGDDDAMYRTNLLGSTNVFEAAKKHKAKVIFASSAAVYGNQHPPQDEGMECIPVSMYGKTKYKAEKIAPEGSFIARLFNVYGPGGHGAVNSFCKHIPKYEEVTVYGTGMQTRDYVYISDVVDAFMLGLSNSGTYNVATGREMSVLSIIDLIFNITRNKPVLKFEMPREGEVSRSYADISNIQKLGWQPKVHINQGLKMLIGANS